MNNNPLNHTDPTGHGECDGIQDPGRRASCQNANATNTPAPKPTNDQCVASNNYAPGCSGYQSQQTTPPPTSPGASGSGPSPESQENGTTGDESGGGNEKLIEATSNLSTGFEGAATAISSFGAGMEAVGFATGGPVGFLGAATIYDISGLKGTSNALSGVSTLATILNGVLTKENRITASEGLVLNNRTVNSIITTTAGIFSPEAITGTIFNGIGLYFSK